MNTTDRILSRMTAFYLPSTPEDALACKATGNFYNSMRRFPPKEETSYPFNNFTPYLALIQCSGASRTQNIAPWTKGRVTVYPIDRNPLPRVKYLAIQFFQSIVPLKEFQQDDERRFTLGIDFSKFTHAKLEWNRKGELQLKVKRENQGVFEFTQDLGESDIEDSIICVRHRNGEEDRSYFRYLSEDPKTIESITVHVNDGDEVKTIVLLAEGE